MEADHALVADGRGFDVAALTERDDVATAAAYREIDVRRGTILEVDNVSLRVRVQDYMIDWPAGKMFADPTRSYPFVLGK